MKAFLLCALSCLLAVPSYGQVVHGESPRTSMLEVRLGGYKPLVNREASVTGNPYQATFSDSSMLLFELEYDRQLWQGFGTAALGFSIGYAEKYADAVAGGDTTTAVGEKTALKVLPMRVLGVYRLDYAAVKHGFPLVPYGKVGLVYTPWWATKGGHVSPIEGGGRASGGKWGYQGSLGLSFLMDILEPRLARDFDTDMGVNHTYVFAEYTYENVNNFGKAGLDLSSRHFSFGFAFEF